MKTASFVSTCLLLLLLSATSHLHAQCTGIALKDSSFESGVFDAALGWGADDGIQFSSSPVHDGSLSVCANGGGAYQYLELQANTTYYASCWVKNGLHNFTMWVTFPTAPYVRDTGLVSTNNWEFVTMAFNSGADTTGTLRFYSMQACVDQFRVTCTPLTSAVSPVSRAAVQCFPNPVSASSPLTVANLPHGPHQLRLYDVQGKLIKSLAGVQNGPLDLGHSSLVPGIYFLQLWQKGELTATGKWVLE